MKTNLGTKLSALLNLLLNKYVSWLGKRLFTDLSWAIATNLFLMVISSHVARCWDWLIWDTTRSWFLTSKFKHSGNDRHVTDECEQDNATTIVYVLYYLVTTIIFLYSTNRYLRLEIRKRQCRRVGREYWPERDVTVKIAFKIGIFYEMQQTVSPRMCRIKNNSRPKQQTSSILWCVCSA